MNLAEAREGYVVVREHLLRAKEHLLEVSKRIAKAEGTLRKHADAHADAVSQRDACRDELRDAAAVVPSALAEELASLSNLGPNIIKSEWTEFERAREELLKANRDVSEIERRQAEAKALLETGELERAEAHVEFLKWQKNALKAAAEVERFLQVEVAGMAPQARSQEPTLEIDPEIEPLAPPESEAESCQNPQ